MPSHLAPFLLVPLLLVATPATSRGEERPLGYNRDIRPILSDNCFHCHGPDKKSRDSGLRLDIQEDATKPAESGFVAIVPGKPDESELITRILSEDRDDIMPPPKSHKKLTPAQKDIIRRWVAQGAKYEPHWAYAPVTRPPVPAPASVASAITRHREKAPSRAGELSAAEDALTNWPRNPIDRFVLERLLEEGIAPAPRASAETLCRRLHLDLTGLPPKPGAVDAFVHAFALDPDAATAGLVDTLLASPQYGERMAQTWLDLARYADTVGFHGDQNQNVWPYRDWVIDAYNSNKPFDQFTIEQLAGDLLPNPTPEQLTATCFNRLNMMTREGGAQSKEYLVKYTADRIRTVGTTWLGSTLGCAECHDHKFDPWSQKDVYAIGAYFADVKQWGVYADYPYTPNPDLKGVGNEHPFAPEIEVESAALKRRMVAIRERIARLVSEAQPAAGALTEWQGKMAAYLAKNPGVWETPKAKITVKPAKPEAVQTPDGRIVVEVKSARLLEMDVTPGGGWLAAIRLELLPDPKHGNRVLRTEADELGKASFEIVAKGGATRGVPIRHAQADRSRSRYSSGAALLGVQAGWKLDLRDPTAAHTAVYFPEKPVALNPGDVLRISLPENVLGSFRVSTSPLAPLDLGRPSFADDIAASLATPQTGAEYFLRSTAWSEDAYAALAAAESDLLECRQGRTPVLVTERATKPLTIRVLPRGNWQDETGEICDPATPAFLPKVAEGSKGPQTRLDLAKWIVAPENPLTSRVVMNRLWRQFFGTGLSAQTDDLGAQGEAPSHPELLDWLAAEFRDGWDTKRMVRLIVTSAAYQQEAGLRASLRDRDPQNRLLASQNPRRLDAEFVRDNALAVAGLLNLEMGGVPSRPYQPEEYYADLQFPSRKYKPDQDRDQYRRGIYTWWQRTLLHPMLVNFDAPSREDCIAMRTSANTPQQALTLLNDPTFVEAARAWAGRLLSKADGDPQRLEMAFREALSRPPRPDEAASLLRALSTAREEYAANPGDVPKLLAVGLAPAAQEKDGRELAAWTTVCRIILNLHETITRY